MIVVQLHLFFAHLSGVGHSHSSFLQTDLLGNAPIYRRLGDKGEGCGCDRATEATEHGPHVDWLRRGNTGIGIPHLRPRDRAPLDYQLRLNAKERRTPEAEVGQLAFFHRANVIRHTVGNGRINRVLGHVALGADIVVLG